VTVAPRRGDRRAGAERRRTAGPWSGRDRRAGIDRRKGERRHGFGRRAGALTVPRRFPDSGPAAVPRGRVLAESGIVAGAVFALALLIGLGLESRDVLVPYSVGSFSSSWSTWHAPPGSDLALGYDEPPLLPLLELPFTVDTAIAQRLTVLPVVSAVIGGALAGIVNAVLAGFRVPTLPRLVATALIVLNPAWLYFTTTGLPTVGGMMAVLAGFYGLVNWLRFGNLLWILVSSAGLALGVVAWYPVTTWAIGAVVLLVAVLVARRRPVAETFGVLLIYALPLVFTMGVWTLVVVAGTGDVPPWLSSAPPGAGIGTSTLDFALLLAPLAVAMVVALAVYVPRRPDAVGAGVALFLLVPLLIAVLRRALDPEANAGAGSLFYVILPTVAIIVTASVYAELGRRLRIVVSTTLAVLLVAGNALLLGWMLDGSGRPVNDFARFVTGRPLTASVPPAVEVGRWLDENATAGRVAVAAGVDERSQQTVAMMAGMPDLLQPPERPPLWLVHVAGTPVPGGFEPAFSSGGLEVVART